MEVEDLKLEVLVRLTDSELEVGPSMENMALVMSGQGSGVAGPAVLLEKDKLEMLSQREGRGPDTEREQAGSSSSSSELQSANYSSHQMFIRPPTTLYSQKYIIFVISSFCL